MDNSIWDKDTETTATTANFTLFHTNRKRPPCEYIAYLVSLSTFKIFR